MFNHGYIPPVQYATTERYVAYQDGFARSGYITFKSDYRGHGQSEGQAAGGYGSNGYTIDVLNALATLELYTRGVTPPVKNLFVDRNRIGMWGHSMGGFITLRAMVVRPEIKAGVIWGGVVASYPDLIGEWRKLLPNRTLPSRPPNARSWRQLLVREYGEPNDTNPFWKTLSANNYLSDISGPVQLHSGTLDEEVPYQFSEKLEKQLKAKGKTVELYLYEGDNHNINGNFNLAEQRSIDFFDKYVKGV
jgi:dipeptidyl aminopeptidase/acylaminoacyl peptidase